jgi:hypothetical protein
MNSRRGVGSAPNLLGPQFLPSNWRSRARDPSAVDALQDFGKTTVFGLLSRSETGWRVDVLTDSARGGDPQFWREAPASWRLFELEAVPWAIVRLDIPVDRDWVLGSLSFIDTCVHRPSEDEQERFLGAVVEVLAAGGPGLTNANWMLGRARLELLPGKESAG